MNALFIAPRSDYYVVLQPPLGLLSIAAAVRREVRIQFIDCNAERIRYRDLSSHIRIKPDFIATVSQYTRNIDNVLALKNTLKRLFPDIPIIVGGAHANMDYKNLIEEGFDYVVRGEGEKTMEELIHSFSGNNGKKPDNIKGIAYGKDNNIKVNENHTLIKDLDTLPYPAWDIIKERCYNRSPFGKTTLIETSRGCIFQCTFCSPTLLWQYKWRKKSPERVAEEFVMAEKRGAEFAFLAELDPAQEPEHMMGFCEALLRRDNKVKWYCQIRADNIIERPEMVRLMYRAGCRIVNVGYESMSPKTLKLFRKEIDPERNQKALHILKGTNLVTNGGFILGTPGETGEEMEKTIDFARGIDFPDFAILRPYPGTPWDTDPNNKNKYNLFNQGYCFLHENPSMVEGFHKKAVFITWCHPSRLLKLISTNRWQKAFARWRYGVYLEVLLRKRMKNFYKEILKKLKTNYPRFLADL